MRLAFLAFLVVAGCDVSGTVGADDTSGLDTNWEPTCTSEVHWTRGDAESPQMHPGVACIDCHESGRGPRLTAAGTVMGAAHDEDDCNGAAQVTVTITDANGTQRVLTTNPAGNFYTNQALVFPITAIVERDGVTAEMVDPVDSGDCNSCHTLAGDNDAPGRIVAQ